MNHDFIALVFSFFAWHFGLWSAADGKLFLAYSGLVPLVVYSRTYFAYFPSFVILINTFFPVFVYYAIKSVFFTGIGEKREFIKKIKPGMLIELLLMVFWITWISRLLSVFVNLDIGFLGSILIMVGIIFFVERLTNIWKISIPLCLLRILFDYYYVFSPAFIWEFIVMSLILVSIFFVIMFSGGLFTKPVYVKKLKPGMMLSDYVYREKGKYKKMGEMEMLRMLSEGAGKRSDLLRIGKTGEGLSREEAEKIKKLEKEKKLDFSVIEVTQTLPFSPFLFLGVLLTVIAGGNFLLLFL